jgi:hypothetical protein
MAPKIRWRRTEDPLEIRDLACCQRRICDMTGADRHIGMISNQVYDTIGDRQLHTDLGIALEKIRNGRSKLVHPESIAGVHMQAAARRTAHSRNLGLNLIHVGKESMGARKVNLALGRQGQSTSRPVQETHTQAALQPTYQLGYGRRGKVKRLRGCGEALALDDMYERPCIKVCVYGVCGGVTCRSLAWMTGPVGWPVGEPPSGSSEIPNVALLMTAGS